MVIIDEHELQDYLRDESKSLKDVLDYVYDKLREINDELSILEGSGSPEGVLEANPNRLYKDTSGTAGNILYIKKTGTGSTGWILV